MPDVPAGSPDAEAPDVPGDTGNPIGATIGSDGGMLTIPGGPTIVVPPSTLASPVTITVGPAASAPIPGAGGYTILSPWYELATDPPEVFVQNGEITLDIPVAITVEMSGHPGLQILAIIDGATFPVDGSFDATTGRFHVELLGLPPSFVFAVAFNPNIKMIASDDVLPSLDRMAVAEDSAVAGWSTVDWWVVFDDDRAAGAAGVEKVLAWARNAASIYSNAGLKEPFLRKVAVGSKQRWVVHVTTDDSYFCEDCADGGVFGCVYINRNRISASPTDKQLGSGQASVAHELFHAVFSSYHISQPSGFRTTAHGKSWRGTSTSGFNEGMATAAGYWVDKGAPATPRPSEPRRPIWCPSGWFDVPPAQVSSEYQNQDFYAYLLRIGSLANFRLHLEALAKATLSSKTPTYLPTSVAFDRALLSDLSKYNAALDASPTGLGDNFTQSWAWYAADRAYIHSSAAQLWEGQDLTTGYKLDSALFSGGCQIQIADQDCTQSASTLDCEVEVPESQRYPLGAVLVTARLGTMSLPSALASQPLTASLSATVSGGTAAFTAFGENNDSGDATATARSPSGGTVTLANVGRSSSYSTVRVIAVPSGSDRPDLKVKMSFSGICPADREWNPNSQPPACQCKPGLSPDPSTGACVAVRTDAGTGDAPLDAAADGSRPDLATPVIVNSVPTETYTLANGDSKLFYFDAVPGHFYCISDLWARSYNVYGYVSTSPSVSPSSYEYATNGSVGGTLAFSATAARYYIAVTAAGDGTGGSFWLQVADGGELLTLGTNTLTLDAPDGDDTYYFRIPISAGVDYTFSVTGPSDAPIQVGLTGRAEQFFSGAGPACILGMAGHLPLPDQMIPAVCTGLDKSYSSFYYLSVRVLTAVTIAVTLVQSG